AALVAPEEVGDAQMAIVALAREGEAQAFVSPVVVGPDDEVVPVGIDREVTPTHRGDEPAFRLRFVELRAQDRPDPLLEFGVVLLDRLIGPELPLVAEQRGLVEEGCDVVERDALRDAWPEEWRLEDLDVGRDV